MTKVSHQNYVHSGTKYWSKFIGARQISFNLDFRFEELMIEQRKASKSTPN